MASSNSIQRMTESFFGSITIFMRMFWNIFSRLHLFVKNPDLTTRQMKIIGIGSFPLVLVTSVFIGAETVVQASFQFQGLVPMRYLGFVVSKSLVTELAPVLTAFVVSSRISTAIAAEIGSMKNSEQLDAMICLSLDSTRYVIVPKVIASTIMLPVLVIFAEFLGFLSSTVVAYFFLDVTMSTYVEGLRLFFSPHDMLLGIGKTAIFGTIISLSGAHFGLECAKGAEGIGSATTRAVMLSAMLILIVDFVVALLFL